MERLFYWIGGYSEEEVGAGSGGDLMDMKMRWWGKGSNYAAGPSGHMKRAYQ